MNEIELNGTKYCKLASGDWEFSVDGNMWEECHPLEFDLLDHIARLQDALNHLGDELEGQVETGKFGRTHFETVYWRQLISVARDPSILD